jgi:hypothetical protein
LAITNIFDLDINEKDKENTCSFYINQTDYQSRTVRVNLYITYVRGENSCPYNLTSEPVKILYQYTDLNGSLIYTDEIECTKETSLGNHVITFLIPNEVCENYGCVKGQLKIYEDTDVVLNSSLFLFYINSSI